MQNTKFLFIFLMTLGVWGLVQAQTSETSSPLPKLPEAAPAETKAAPRVTTLAPATPSSDEIPLMRSSANPQLPRPVEFLGFSYDWTFRVLPPPPPSKSIPFQVLGRDQQIQTFAARWVLSPRWALRTSWNYAQTTARLQSGSRVFSSQNTGFGDSLTQLAWTARKTREQWMELRSGFSLPLGTIDEQWAPGIYAPPKTQLGSGTYDWNTQLIETLNTRHFLAINQLTAIVRTGTNSRGYRLGDSFGYKGSISYSVWKYFSPLIAGRYIRNESLAGDASGPSQAADASQARKRDPDLVSGATTTKNPKPSTFWDLSVGARSVFLLGQKTPYKIFFEAGLPLINSDKAPVGREWLTTTGVLASF